MILSQLHPLTILTSYFLKIHLNVTLPSPPLSSKRFPLSKLRVQPIFTFFISVSYPKSQSSLLCNISCYLLPLSLFRLKYFPDNTFYLCSSFGVRSNVSHSYKTRSKMNVLHILILSAFKRLGLMGCSIPIKISCDQSTLFLLVFQHFIFLTNSMEQSPP